MTSSPQSFFSAVRDWVKRPIFGLAIFFFVFYYVTFFPGILREDSSDQLGQALRHQINDWHSPVMTWIWSWINRVYCGPAGMLFLIDLFFFLGLAIILGRAFAEWRRQLNVLLLFTLFPINFCVIGSVNKTSFFCATLLLAIALAGLSSLRKGPRLLWGALSSLLLFLSIAIRPDGVAAVLPVFGWMIWNSRFSLKHPRRRIFQVTALSLLASLGSYGLIAQINGKICEGRKTYPEQVFLASDLTALSLAQGRILLPPSVLNSGVDLDRLRSSFHPSCPGLLYWATNPPLHKIADEADFRSLWTCWKHQVIHHPFLYLKNRLEASYYFLGPDNLPYAAPTFSVWNNTWGYFPSFAAVHADFHPGALSSLEVLFYFYTQNWFFERPWFFVFLGLCNILYLIKKDFGCTWRSQVSLLLTCSGLAHLAMMFLVTPDTDYRYSSWLISSSSLACLLTLMGNGGTNRDASAATFATCPEKS